jgi:hypothetical protein
MIALGVVYIGLALYFLTWAFQSASFSVPLHAPADAIMMARAEQFFSAFVAFLGIGLVFLLALPNAERRGKTESQEQDRE